MSQLRFNFEVLHQTILNNFTFKLLYYQTLKINKNNILFMFPLTNLINAITGLAGIKITDIYGKKLHSQQEIQISQLRIQHLNQIIMIQKVWHVVTKINIDENVELIKQIKSNFTASDVNFVDKRFINLIYILIQDIKNLKITISSNSRSKRAICDGCGGVLNKLFGLSTEKEINRVEEKIKEVGKIQEGMLHIEEEKITIIEETHNNTLINKKKIENVYELLKDYEVATSTIYNLLQMSAILQEIDIDIREYHVAILSAQVGVLKPTILPPSRLIKIIEYIQKTTGNKMIVNDYDNLLHEIYNSASVQVRGSEEGLKIYISIPIIEEQNKFDLYSVQSVPLPNHKTEIFAYIKVEKPYFAISKDRSNFIDLSQHQVNQCKETSKNILLCNFQSHFLRDKKLSCVWSIFTGLQNDLCQVSLIRDFPPMSYQTEVGYVYAVSRQITLSIICKNNSKYKETVTIFGTGILKLNQGCSAVSSEIYFPAIEQIVGESHIEVSHKITNFTWDLIETQEIDFLRNKSDDLSQVLKNNPLKRNFKINKIKEEILELKRKNSYFQKFRNNTPYLMFIIILLIILSPIAFCVYRLKNRRRRILAASAVNGVDHIYPTDILLPPRQT